MSSLTSSNDPHDPMEDQDHENIPPPAAAPNHAPSKADSSPTPQSDTKRHALDGGVASLYGGVMDKRRNAMATLGQSPIKCPDLLLEDERLPELSMLDSMMEVSHLSTAEATSPAAASHSSTPRYSKKMKSALTPIFKTPGPVCPAGQDVSLLYREVITAECHNVVERLGRYRAGPEGSVRSPCFWLQDETLPEVSMLDSTAESSHLSTTLASHLVRPPSPRLLQPELDTTQVLSGNAVEVASGSGNGTFISPQDGASVNTNVTMETTDPSGSKSGKSSPRNETLESKHASGDSDTSGLKLQDTFEVVAPPTPGAPGCSQDNQIGGQDNRSSEDNRTFEAPPLSTESHDGANSTLVIAVDLPVQSENNTTQVVSGNAAEAASDTVFFSPQDDAKVSSPLVNTNITMEMEFTPISRPGANLHNTFVKASPPKPSALTCCEDNLNFGPLDFLGTSTPMPNCKVYTFADTDGPSKPPPQTSPAAASADHVAPPTARALLPPSQPISHLLRYNPAPSDTGRPETHPLAATHRVKAVAPPPHKSKPKTTGIPNPTSLRPALPAKPRQSLCQAKRSLGPWSGAVALTKRKRTAGCPNCALWRHEVEKKDAELRRLQKELQKLKAERRQTNH
ncbi:unnamed protein product [Merluccius merluccius]